MIFHRFTEDEDISSLNPNLLLYKSAGVHNLPVMCHAFALGASKSWTNANDANRTALHQAILSVSGTHEMEIGFLIELEF